MKKLKILKQHKTLLYHLKEAIIEYYGKRLVSLIIFGSIARGVATEKSDVDILIIAENLPKGRIKRVDEFESIESSIKEVCKFDFLLSPVIKTKEEVLKGSPLFWDMTAYSIIVYDKEDFFKKYLLKLKKDLKKLGAERKEYGDGWIWILKKDFTPKEVFKI